MRSWILCWLAFTVAGNCLADEASLQFDQANQLYRGGEFQKAGAMYEQIVKNGYESPSLYYNLGNTYFKLRKIPAAILNYERAKRLAPHDEDISYNLRLSNLHVVDKVDVIPPLFFVEWWRSFLNLMSADGWSVLVIGALWCMVVSAGVFLISRSMLIRRVTLPLAFCFLTAALLSLVAMMQRSRIEESEMEAIVFSPSVSAKSAPDAQSTDLFVLHEGVKAELTDSVAGWKKIRLADGKVGWIPAEAVQPI